MSKSASKDINITGSVQAGTLSSGDGATSIGTSNAMGTSRAIAVHNLLDAAAELMKDSGVEPAIKKELDVDVAQAKADPSPGRIDKVIKGLAKLETASSSSEKVITAAHKLWEQLSTLIS